MKGRRFSGIMLWSVYAFVALATFRHSAWGFGTLESIVLAPLVSPEGLAFWVTGGMAAVAVDAGMAGLVFAIREGMQLRRLYFALAFVMFCSAFTQLLYGTTHAVPSSEMSFNVAAWMAPFVVFVWEVRVLVLPLLLPGLGLLYAFTAKMASGPSEEGRPEQEVRGIARMIDSREMKGPFRRADDIEPFDDDF